MNKMESLENIEELRETIREGIGECFKPLKEIYETYAITAYYQFLTLKIIKFGQDKPPEHIVEQLKKMDDNPYLLLCRIMLIEETNKSENFHFKLSETELIYNSERLILNLKAYLGEDYIGKFKFYREFNSKEWFPEF